MALAGALVLRVARALGPFLAPDEALHELLASQASFGEAWRAALTNAHPPLLVILLHYWRALGHSELILRLPSVLAGTASCWLGYRWLRLAADRAAALAGLLLLCFAPALVELSAEVRQYALLLCFVTACLFFAERAVQEESPAHMALYSLSLLGALSTHYSALIFALTMGVVLAVRLAPWMLPARRRRLVAVWACGQAVALAVAGYFLATHVAHLRQSGMTRSIAETYMRGSMFQPGDSVVRFAAVETVQLFGYLLGGSLAGGAALGAFLAGLVTLLARRGAGARAACGPGGEPISPAPSGAALGGPRRRPRPGMLGLLLALPFVITCGVALAGLYPYGGTRHDVVLAPFALAGAAFGLTAWRPLRRPRRTWIMALGLAAGLALCNVDLPWQRPAGPSRSRDSMREAVAALAAAAPAGSVLIADYQGGLLLGHYLCGRGVIPVFWPSPSPSPVRAACGPYTAVIAPPQRWIVDPAELPEELDWIARTWHFAPGTRIWWFEAGRVDTPPVLLRRRLRRLGWPSARIFGDDIVICDLTDQGDEQE